MGRILINWRITLASLFSVALIGGAYLLARGIERPTVAEASSETALLQAIATKDTDGDGLPDWEEALYGTNPRIVDTNKLGMTDGEAVAKGLVVAKAIADVPQVSTTAGVGTDGLPPAPKEGTLTAAFSQTFFTLYLQAKQNAGGGDLSESQMAAVVNAALNELKASVAPAPDYKKASELTIAGSGREALLTYAANAEAILEKNVANATTSEINYLHSALIGNTPDALTHIASISSAYRASATGLAVLPVPTELAPYHLKLVNSLMRLSQIIGDFAHSNDDPLAAILALGQYIQAAQALGVAFGSIEQVYSAGGVTPSAGSPGAAFVGVAASVAATRSETRP